MRVLYIPYYGGSNAYQKLLTNAVAEHGVNPIEGSMFLFFPLVRNVLAPGRPELIHLIWTHPFFVVGEYTGFAALDAIISCGRAVLFILDLSIVRVLGIDIVWTVHNKHNHEKHHLWLDRAVNRAVGGLSSMLTVECESARTIIVEIFNIDPKKIVVIPEGNYIGAYPDNISRYEARDWLNLDQDAFIFVYFGMIRRYKGLPDLFEAFEHVDDALLYVSGNPYSDNLAKNVRERVNSMPNVEGRLEFIPDDEVQYYMRAADVVVLPYRDILTSGSVLLAMSFGRPIVVPRIGCIPMVLPEDGGFLFDEKDRSNLIEKLQESRSFSREELDAMGDLNYQRARNLSWDDIGHDTVKIYRQLLNQG
jgi:glycosyltransferase involved in cell wall biosynthesis